MPTATKVTLLVENDTLSVALNERAADAFFRGKIVRVLDTASGQDGFTLVEMEFHPDDYAAILAADQFAVKAGKVAPIQVAETQG